MALDPPPSVKKLENSNFFFFPTLKASLTVTLTFIYELLVEPWLFRGAWWRDCWGTACAGLRRETWTGWPLSPSWSSPPDWPAPSGQRSDQSASVSPPPPSSSPPPLSPSSASVCRPSAAWSSTFTVPARWDFSLLPLILLKVADYDRQWKWHGESSTDGTEGAHQFSYSTDWVDVSVAEALKLIFRPASSS